MSENVHLTLLIFIAQLGFLYYLKYKQNKMIKVIFLKFQHKEIQ